MWIDCYVHYNYIFFLLHILLSHVDVYMFKKVQRYKIGHAVGAELP